MSTPDKINDLLSRAEKLPKTVHSRKHLDWIGDVVELLDAVKREHKGLHASLRNASTTVEGLLTQQMPSVLWIVGQHRAETDAGNVWDIQGVFSTREKALAACRGPNYFIGPIKLNEELPDETVEWPGREWPPLKDADGKAVTKMKTLNETVNDLLIRVIRLPKPIPNQEHFAWINDVVGLLHELKNATGVVLPDGISLIDTKELAAIRQLLSRLPQTADGVTVHPGHRLWRVGPGGSSVKPAVVQPVRVTSLDGCTEIYALGHCYSTIEAAEAEANIRRQLRQPQAAVEIKSKHGKAVTE